MSRFANAAAGPAERGPLRGSEAPPRPAGRGAGEEPPRQPGAAAAARAFNGRHGVRFSLGRTPRPTRRAPRAERRAAGGRSPPRVAPRPRQVCTAPPTWPLAPRAPLNSPSAGGRGGAGHTHREGPLHLLPAAPPPSAPQSRPERRLAPRSTEGGFYAFEAFFPLRAQTGARRKRAAPRTAPPPAVSGGAAPGRAGPR